jgi:hypothetical protein
MPRSDRRLRGRLARLESRVLPPTEPFTLWLNRGDGRVRNGRTGEVLSVEEYHKRYPDAKTFTITLDIGDVKIRR